MKEVQTVLDQILSDQEEQISVSDDGIQTIAVLAESQVDLEEQIEELLELTQQNQ